VATELLSRVTGPTISLVPGTIGRG